MATSNVIDKSNYLPMPSADRQFMLRDMGITEQRAISRAIESREGDFKGEVVEAMVIKQAKTNRKIGVVGYIETDANQMRITRYEAAELRGDSVVSYGDAAFGVLNINPNDLETAQEMDAQASDKALVSAISKSVNAHNVGALVSAGLNNITEAKIEVEAPDERKKMQGIYKLKALINIRKEEVERELEEQADNKATSDKPAIQAMKNELFQLNVRPQDFLVADGKLLNPSEAADHMDKLESVSYKTNLQDVEGNFLVETVGGLKENALVRLLGKEDAHYLGATEVRNLETNEHVLIYGMQDAQNKVWLRAEGRNDKGRLSAHNDKAFAMLGINADHLLQGTKGMNPRQTPGMNSSVWREQAMDDVLQQMSVNSLRSLINKGRLKAYDEKSLSDNERLDQREEQKWFGKPETLEAVVVDKFMTVSRMNKEQLESYHKYSSSDEAQATNSGFIVEHFSNPRAGSTGKDTIILTQQRQHESNTNLSDRFAVEGEMTVIAEVFDQNGLVEIERASNAASLSVQFDEKVKSQLTEYMDTLNTQDVKEVLSSSFHIGTGFNNDTSITRLKGDYGLSKNEHPIIGIEKERMERADGTWVEPEAPGVSNPDVAVDLFGAPIPQSTSRKNKM